ncbi:hypothetical protein ACO22_01151 [Paracoccidioides brasiliensis]|uniref:DUF7770 domain-containing protein n=1 Tax=Paracoccidioides brasiliensis TaxID=121759 RepID=A0A1D2JMK9_PARBR|nr:hypothetical protein ACO22_01151 [Paracoccidioides brasiliensis]
MAGSNETALICRYERQTPTPFSSQKAFSSQKWVYKYTSVNAPLQSIAQLVLLISASTTQSQLTSSKRAVPQFCLGTTAQTILEAIKSANYDRYKFAEGGQGCRFWLDKVAALMQENRITDSESETQAARSALQQVCYSESQLFPAAQITGMTPGASH